MEKEDILLLTEVIAPFASPRLRELLLADAKKIAEATSSIGQTAKTAIYRLGSRLVRMFSLNSKKFQNIAGAVGIGGTVSQIPLVQRVFEYFISLFS